jgi:hypothetical protein
VRRWYHRYQQGSLSFPVVLVVWRTLWRRRSNLWVPPIYIPTGPGSPRLDSPKKPRLACRAGAGRTLAASNSRIDEVHSRTVSQHTSNKTSHLCFVVTHTQPSMVYDALEQRDLDDRFEESDFHAESPISRLASPNFNGGAAQNRLGESNTMQRNQNYSSTSASLSHMVQSITSRRSTKTNSSSYDMVEEDDYYEIDQEPSSASSIADRNNHRGSPIDSFVPLSIPRPRPRRPVVSVQATAAKISPEKITFSSDRILPAAPLRTASGHSIALRHPTPDLQTLQGAYTGNIEHLERTAERLSMTSSIDDAIRELHAEQKRNDSRRSSLLSSPDMPTISRQVSHASSIMETNNLARSGGYSPAGFIMSPTASFTGGRGRSASKSSKYGSRPEPELEGRPLDSFVGTSSGVSPVLSRSESIAEQDEESTTLTRPVVDLLDGPILDLQLTDFSPTDVEEKEIGRPSTSASVHTTNTFEQAEKMFADFDGDHSAQQRSISANERDALNIEERRLSAANLLTGEGNGSQRGGSSVAGSDARRVSSGNRMSMARPQSYADPHTGQQMVYYPAPVPMMLNLPQKLSKMPSSMARSKRRTQVLSTVPPAARQSAIWLPDVLEIEDEPDLAEHDEAQQMEYVPQHQRASMGGRQLAQDAQNLPPQLRAHVFFDIPGPNQTVELKNESAVATLDSILDASAHAPVSAFTDHAFAGHLGAEVYGKPHLPKSRTASSMNLLGPEEKTAKKRTSSFNLLSVIGRRASSADILDSENEKRRATMADIRAGKIIRDEDEDEDAVVDDEDEEEGEEEEEVYTGAPTTLLAELQLRKQQQKHRTRGLATAYPNGMHATLLELDAVAQVEQKTRKTKKVSLAWEDPTSEDEEHSDEEDVPLALLYHKKNQVQELNRPMGLMERRDMEDNEPLSRRRDRLQGKPPAMNRASTMMNLGMAAEEENETLAQRTRRLKEAGRSSTGLPTARPVSGDFASEMAFQFGVDLQVKNPDMPSKTPQLEEEETLGQRRKRLQAEAAARAKEVGSGGISPGGVSPGGEDRPELKKRHSMADILQAHPSAGASRQANYQKPPSGLLGLHEKVQVQRSSTMQNIASAAPVGGFKKGMYNDGQGGIIPPSQPMPQLQQRQNSQTIPQLQQRQSSYNLYSNTGGFQQQAFPQPSLGFAQGGFNGYGTNNNMFGGLPAMNPQMMMPFANPFAMNMFPPMAGYPQAGGMNIMPNPMMGAAGMQPLNQGQIDMVERWRQSIMQ